MSTIRLLTYESLAAALAATQTAGRVRTTSTSSVAVGTGSKTFALAQPLGLAVGTPVMVFRTSDATVWMIGTLTALSDTSATVEVVAVSGVGTFTDWTVTLAGLRGATGAQGIQGPGFRFQGVWDSETEYAPLDVVVHEVESTPTVFIAITTHEDSEPPSADWVSLGAGDPSEFASRTAFEAHAEDTNNPHEVTAAQVGAYETADVDTMVGAVASDLAAHIADDQNPHSLTPEQIGAAAADHSHVLAIAAQVVSVAPSGSYADVHESLSVTFTAPTSGKVLVRLTGPAYVEAFDEEEPEEAELFWRLHDGAAQVGGEHTAAKVVDFPGGGVGAHASVAQVFTSLSGEKTWKWQAKRTGDIAAMIGTCVMEVWALP